MIKSLRIRNFQKHKRLQLDLHPKITVITGRTSAGKSSILRSFRWLCLNDPSGDKFIHSGASFAKVVLELEQHTITRKRGKTNSYQIDDNKPLVAFGQGVPEDVANLLNVGPINFSDQFDALHWFSLSSPEVGRQLNSIVNLSLIDQTQVNLASVLRKVKVEVTLTEERLTKAVEQRDKLSWVERAEEKLAKIENLDRDIEKRTLACSRLHSALEGLTRLSKAISGGSRALRGAEKALLLTSQVEEKEVGVRRLKNLLSKIKEVELLCKEKEKRYMQEERDLIEEMGEKCPMCNSLLTSLPSV